MLTASETIELCMSMYTAPSMTPRDKCEVVKILRALGTVHKNWSDEVKALVDFLREDAQFESAVEESSCDKVQKATDMDAVGEVLESLWKDHPLGTKLRSRLRNTVAKKFPSLTASFKLARCVLTVTFYGFHKRSRSEFEDGVTADVEALPAALAHRRSGGSDGQLSSTGLRAYSRRHSGGPLHVPKDL